MWLHFSKRVVQGEAGEVEIMEELVALLRTLQFYPRGKWKPVKGFPCKGVTGSDLQFKMSYMLCKEWITGRQTGHMTCKSSAMV